MLIETSTSAISLEALSTDRALLYMQLAQLHVLLELMAAVGRAAGSGRNLWGGPAIAQMKSLMAMLRGQGTEAPKEVVSGTSDALGDASSISEGEGLSVGSISLDGLRLALTSNNTDAESVAEANGSCEEAVHATVSPTLGNVPGVGLGLQPDVASPSVGLSASEEARAELEEKLRRSGGPLCSDLSKERQLRHVCARLLKDILVPERGKAD